MYDQINIVQIGSGPWGQRYLETWKQFPNVQINLAGRNNWKESIDQHPDGVVVCTPPQTHIELASYALERNIYTVIEKPVALSSVDVQKLSKYDTSKIFVNYVHLYSDAYSKLKNIFNKKDVSKIITSGFGPSPNRENYSTLWDYGPHDLAQILDLCQSNPKTISAIQTKTNMYRIELDFGKFKTLSTIGNSTDCKSRTITIECSGIQIHYDDQTRPPHHNQPLYNFLNDFLLNIHYQNVMIFKRNGLSLSLEITKILEACDKSLQMNSPVDY